MMRRNGRPAIEALMLVDLGGARIDVVRALNRHRARSA
jgi:hypothetical protein